MPLNTRSLGLVAGSSQFASRADTASLSTFTDISIELWINLTQLPSTLGSPMGLVTKWDTSSANRSYYTYIDSADDRIHFGVTDDGSFDDGNRLLFSGDTAIVSGDVGNWVHVAITFDISAETCVIYTGGSSMGVTLDQGTTMGDTIYDGTSEFAIGAYNTDSTPTYYFDGLMDEVRVWNDLRTGSEISNNNNDHIDAGSDNLVGYWRLENNYTDETSNNNDLTGSGSPAFNSSVPFVGTAPIGSVNFMPNI
jgi:hypothetical protein